MADQKLQVKISVDGTDASKAVQDFIDKLNGILPGLQNSAGAQSDFSDTITKSSIVLTGFNQALELASKLYEAIPAKIGGAIDAFVEADTINQNLASTLKITGEYSETAMQQFQDFANVVKETTTVDDDLTLSLIQQSKAFGLTNDAAQKLVKAAAGLAAINKGDLAGSFTELISLSNGTVGKLAKIFPELKALSPAALKAGEGLDVVTKRVAGFAEAYAQTTEGIRKQTANVFSDIEKEIGSTFFEIFNIPDKEAAKLQFAKTILEKVKEVKAVLLEFKDDVKNTFTALSESINQVDLKGLTESFISLTGVATTFFIVLRAQAIWTAFTAAISSAIGFMATAQFSITGLTIALTGMRVDLTAVAVQVWATVGPVVALTSGIIGMDIALRNLPNIFNLIYIGVLKISEGFIRAEKGIHDFITSAAEAVGIGVKVARSVSDKDSKRLIENLKEQGKLFDEMNKKGTDFGLVGKIYEQTTKFVSNFSGSLADANTKSNEAKKSAEDAGKKGREAAVLDYDTMIKRKDALDEIIKKNGELRGEILKSFGTQQQLAAFKTSADIAEIARMEAKLKRENLLTPELKKQLDVQKQLVALTNQITAAQITSASDLAKQSQSLLEQREAIGKSELEIINMANDRELEKINILEDQLRSKGLFNLMAAKGLQNLREEVANRRLNQQLLLDAQKAQAVVNAGPAGSIKSLADAGAGASAVGASEGSGVASAIGGALTKGAGALSSVFSTATSGMLGAVSAAADAIGAILDFIPQLIDKVAGIFNKITDLPNKLASSIGGLFDSIINLVKNFIPNIGKMIVSIVGSIGKLIQELPTALMNLITSLPDIILDIVEGVIDAIPGIVQGLITALPKVAIALIKLIVQGIPNLIVGLVRAVPVLIEAIINGVIEAFMSIGDMIADLFSGIFGGAGDVVNNFGDKIAEGVDSVIEGASDISSQVFQVIDIAAEARGLDAADRIRSAIDSGLSRGANIFEKAWAAFKQAARWIWDNILGPAWEILKQSFMFVWTNILKPAWEFIRDIFMAIWDTGKGILTAAWDYAKVIFEVIANNLRAVWDFVVAIFSTIIDTFKALWNFVKTLFDDPIQAFKNLFTDIGNIFWKIIDAFKNIGGNIWDGFKAAFSGAGDFLMGLGRKIFDGLKAAFDGIGSFLGKLFKDPNPGKGKVEEWIGIDIPFLKFAEGGPVPGIPKVFGDSPKNDIIPALLSPGEVVLPRSIVQDDAYREVINTMLAGKSVAQLYSWDDFKNDAKSVGNTIKSGAEAGGDYIANTASGVASGSVDVFKSLAKGDFSGAIGGLKTILTAPIPEWMKDFFKTLSSLVPSIDLGRFIEHPIDETWRAIKESGKNLLAGPIEMLMKSNKFADGGLVGGTGSGDTVPAWLTPGEFVMNKSAVGNVGTGFLDALNKGRVGSQSGQPQNVTYNIEVNITAQEAMDGNFIASKLVPQIKKELKKASLNGEFILSTKGLRTT